MNWDNRLMKNVVPHNISICLDWYKYVLPFTRENIGNECLRAVRSHSHGIMDRNV